jgi:hypothetical protein
MLEQERFERISRFHEWMLKIGNVYLHSNPMMESAYNRVE